MLWSCPISLWMLHETTTQIMKFSVKDFFSRYEQIRSFLRIWSHLLKKSLMEDFFFCAGYSFYLWASVPSCYLNILKKLRKRVYRTVFLPHPRQNIKSLILIYRYYFGLTWLWYYFHVNWFNWSPALILVGNPPVILRLKDFSILITCYENVYINSSFFVTVWFWNNLPVECFLLTYSISFQLSWLNWFLLLIPVGSSLVILLGWMVFRSSWLYVIRMSMSTYSLLLMGSLWNTVTVAGFLLNGFKSRVQRQLLSLRSFQAAFLYFLYLCLLVYYYYYYWYYYYFHLIFFIIIFLIIYFTMPCWLLSFA